VRVSLDHRKGEKMNLEATVNEYWKAYNAHDLDALLAMMDENIHIYFPVDPKPKIGKEQIKKVWTLSFTTVIPDIHEELHTTIIEKDRAACRATESGSVWIPEEAAQQLGIPAMKRLYKIEIGSFFKFNEQGLIEEIHSYWDTGNFAKQLGIDIGIIQSMQAQASA
jgi:steroid delta-isomerase-like uncharacterized protein